MGFIRVKNTLVNASNITYIRMVTLPESLSYRFRIEYEMSNGDTIVETYRTQDEQFARFEAITAIIDRLI